MATVSCRAPRLRSRTFTGCHACRSRKVKCDLARPGCANCQRMRLRCPGYGTVLSWMPTWLPDWHDHFGQDACLKQQQQERNLRAELLSENDRQMESEKLLNYLNADPAYSDISFLLDDLERKAAQEDVRLTHDIDFQVEVGPYTVFSSRRILSSREDSSCSPRDSSNNNNSSCSSSSSDGLGSQTATLPPISEETAYDEAFSADLLEPYPNLLDAAHLLYDTGLDSDQRRPSMGVASDTSATFPNDIDMMILDMDGRTNSIETQMGDGAPPYGVSGLSLPPGSSSPGAWEHSRDWLQQVTDAGPDDWSPPPPYLDNTTTTTNNNNNLHYNLMCSPPPLTSRFSSGSPYLPPEVRFLLHHYDHHVIDSLSAIPVPRDRAPWRQLHLPCALRAYGELDVLGTSSLARVSLLYSLLSLTCYHLSSLYTSVDLGDVGAAPTPPTQTPNAERWQQRALKFRGIARTAFRKHVASQGTAGGKYKETLMAAMSLICVGVVGGDPWDARLYIRRCEAIIGAATGAKNRFSKRALQLHHIFAFLKIMEETTFCQSQTDYLRFLESSDIPSDEASLVSGRDASRDDLVAWCAGSTKSKGGVVATPRDASSPISVAAPSPPPALQLHILDHNGPLGGLSGVSGKLFEMLIQTNSLIHRIASQSAATTAARGDSVSSPSSVSLEPTTISARLDAVAPGASSSPLLSYASVVVPRADQSHRDTRYGLPQDLLSEAAVLEEAICNWRGHDADADADEEESHLLLLPPTCRDHRECDMSCCDVAGMLVDDALCRPDAAAVLARCMQAALYHTVLVHFFREVRGAHPKILQHYVRKIVANLERHQEVKARFFPDRRIGTIVWPSFVAACEAVDPDLRRRAVLCMRYSVVAGFGNGQAAETVVREVWRRRDGGETNVSWRDVVRQLNVFMLLS